MFCLHCYETFTRNLPVSRRRFSGADVQLRHANRHLSPCLVLIQLEEDSVQE